MNTMINKTDRAMLAHLTPLRGTDIPDSYLCGVSKYIKNEYVWTVEEKVRAWVERNGGTMKRLSTDDNPVCIGEKKGFKVQIRFPSYTKRDMKEIMATLWETPQKKKTAVRRNERSL